MSQITHPSFCLHISNTSLQFLDRYNTWNFDEELSVKVRCQ